MLKSTNTQCFYYNNVFSYNSLYVPIFRHDFSLFLCKKETSLLKGRKKKNAEAHNTSGLHMFLNVGLLMNEAERNLQNPP